LATRENSAPACGINSAEQNCISTRHKPENAVLDTGLGQLEVNVRTFYTVVGAAALFLAVAAPARADGLITPFLGFNFGGDSGYCQSVTNCEEKRANFGVSLATTGGLLGFEEDISFAKNFFGQAPGTDNSVFTAMSNLVVGIPIPRVQPYVLGGFGLIRPHVSLGSSLSVEKSDTAFGYDIGGGVTVYPAAHVGLRGDIRHFHTLEDVNVLIFTSQKLDFWRASAGLAFRF
jgi:opacity protein-like surface antigen